MIPEQASNFNLVDPGLDFLIFRGLHNIHKAFPETAPKPRDVVCLTPGIQLPNGVTQGDIHQAINLAKEVTYQNPSVFVMIQQEPLIDHDRWDLLGTLLRFEDHYNLIYLSIDAAIRASRAVVPGFRTGEAAEQLLRATFAEIHHACWLESHPTQPDTNPFTIPNDFQEYLNREEERAADIAFKGLPSFRLLGRTAMVVEKTVVHFDRQTAMFDDGTLSRSHLQ